ATPDRTGSRDPDDGRRRGSGTVLGAMAWAVWTGSGQRHRLPRQMVRDTKRVVESSRRRQRQFVAHRLARPRAADDGAAGRQSTVVAGVSTIGWRPVVGGGGG